MLPDRVGPYIIEKKLGSGGMGTVYHAFHEETEREVALKVLPATLAREEGFVARFERETEAMKKLSSPHIVEFYETGSELREGDDHPTHFYAMEYVEGETLTQIIRRVKRMPWRDVIEIGRQTCLALKAAHDAGVIHRDLKPSNLMIAKGGIVKLTDFGVAQLFAETRLTATGGVIGTAEFMSPEQAQGARATKRSDLYSLGAVMYAMLTGRPPFSGDSAIDVMHAHRYNQFDRPIRFTPEIPHWLDDLVCQLLEKEPDKRIPDALVLARRLEEILKKVELSGSESKPDVTATRVANGPGGTSTSGEDSLTSDSLYIHGNRVGTDVPPASEADIGGATLVRDLVRAELEAGQQRSVIGKVLDNTFVLLFLLGLLIASGVWWFQRGSSDEERLAAGLEIMNQPESSEWLRAREEYFEPLLTSDPERYGEVLQPELERIRRYELKRGLGLKSGRRKEDVKPTSEAERLLFRARRLIDNGNLAEAQTNLDAMLTLFAGQEEYRGLLLLARELELEVQEMRRSFDGPDEVLRDALARAEKLWNAARYEEARAVWSSLLTLYGNDLQAESFVESAREALQRKVPDADDTPSESRD